VLFVPPLARNVGDKEVLDVDAVCTAIGSKARVVTDVAGIIEAIEAEAEAGDRVLILSNGGFEGIHGRLLDRLH